MKEFTLTKKISRQGSQNMILIPAVLKDKLKHNSLVEVRIRVLDEDEKKADEKSTENNANTAKLEE